VGAIGWSAFFSGVNEVFAVDAPPGWPPVSCVASGNSLKSVERWKDVEGDVQQHHEGKTMSHRPIIPW
jgi:hypothetical protein